MYVFIKIKEFIPFGVICEPVKSSTLWKFCSLFSAVFPAHIKGMNLHIIITLVQDIILIPLCAGETTEDRLLNLPLICTHVGRMLDIKRPS